MKIKVICCLSLIMHSRLCRRGPTIRSAPLGVQWTARTAHRRSINWPQFHFDLCHTGCNPYEFILSPATVGNLVLKWKYTTGRDVDSSPAVANGVVYVGSDDNNVYALNASTGALLWKYTTGNQVDSSPAVANGVVYVGSEDGNVYALNASTGALLWKYTTGGQVDSSPAVANGVVYVGSDDNNVYALNASTGALLWKYTTGDRCRFFAGGGQRRGVRRI